MTQACAGLPLVVHSPRRCPLEQSLVEELLDMQCIDCKQQPCLAAPGRHCSLCSTCQQASICVRDGSRSMHSREAFNSTNLQSTALSPPGARQVWKSVAAEH
eukprot:5863-Heterococcus_DN1.PRE.1